MGTNWLDCVRKQKSELQPDLTVTVSWKDRRVKMSSKPVAQYTIDKEMMFTQCSILSNLKRLVRTYENSLRDNYGNDFLEIAKEYAELKASDPSVRLKSSQYSKQLNKIVDEIVDKDVAEDDAIDRILIDIDLDKLEE